MIPGGGVSRRRLLSSAAAMGALGALTGVGTAAYLTDGEQVRALLGGGQLDLTVACHGDPSCTARGDSVEFALGEVVPGDCGSIDLCLAVSDNPAWLWARAKCPTVDPGESADPDEDAQADLRDYLHARLTHVDGTPVTGVPADGTLADVLAALATGVRIDADPATAEIDAFQPEQDAICLTLSWAAPVVGAATDDSVAYDCEDAVTLADLGAGPRFDFALEFHASQHRHDADATTPWPDAADCDYTPQPLCLDCQRVGKYDLDDDNHLAAGEAYPLLDGDGNATGYELLIQATQENDEGETVVLSEFTLIEAGTANDPVLGPAVCQVVIGGGPPARSSGTRGGGGGEDGGVDGGGSEGGGPVNNLPPVAICPPTAHVTTDLDANSYALSHITVSVCDASVEPDCYTAEEPQ